MRFDLTDGLSDSILSAMENQNVSFVVDAENGILVDVEKGKPADEERYYRLPVWDSTSGFLLRERFVAGLYVPLVREELQAILHSGRGVFRNFKSVLKKYPEIERKWHLFKNHEMRLCIDDWYNALRETWGLERLDQEPEDIEDLVLKDFVFREYDSERDRESILREASIAAGDMRSVWPDEVVNAFVDLWKRQFEYGISGSETGFICLTPSDEIAGCIIFAPCPSCAKTTVHLTSLFVLQNFRGLGIGKELFSLSLPYLHNRGIRWVIIANTIVPDAMIPLLDRSGFEKIGSGFIADLCDKKDIL